MAKKPSWAKTGQRALGGLLTSSAAEKEVGCARRPLALAASAELGPHAKLALLMLRSIPLQGTTPDRARRRTSGSLCGYPFCYESHARVALSPVEGGQRLGPTARLQRKRAVCGLNGFLPRLCLGSLHLNPRPPKDFRGSCPSVSSPAVANGNSCFRFGKKNCALGAHFPSKTESKRFLGGRGGPGRTRPNPACAR